MTIKKNSSILSTLSSNIKQLHMNLFKEGFAETLRRICFRFMKVNKFYIFTLNLSRSIPNHPIPPNTEIKEISYQELSILRKKGERLSSDFYRDKIGNEQRCWVATVSGQLACIIWLNSNPSSGFLKIQPGSLEMNYLYCLPKYRAKKLCTTTITAMANQLKNEMVNSILVVIHESTIAALKVIMRCGFVKTAEVKRWGFLKWGLKAIE